MNDASALHANGDFLDRLGSEISFAIDDLASNPYLDDCREDLMIFVNGLRSRFEEALPGNLVEMGELCAELDAVLDPFMAKVEKDGRKAKDKDLYDFYLKLHKARLQVRNRIMAYQVESLVWEKQLWNQENFEVLLEAKKIICSFLGLPLNPYKKGSQEWSNARSKILKVAYSRDFVEMMGLREAYRALDMSSMYDFLVLLFGEDYDLANDLEDKKSKVDTSSRESILSSYKLVFDKHLGLPAEWPSVERDSWLMYRARILNLDTSEFLKLLGCMPKNEWFKSYYEVLIELYGKYFDVEDNLKSKIAPKNYKWSTREETLANVKRMLVPSDGNLPVRFTKDWFELAAYLSGLTARDFHDLGIAGAIVKNQWFSSHLDVLKAVFEGSGFPTWTFSKLGAAVFRSLVDSDLELHKTKVDQEYLQKYLAGTLSAGELVEYARKRSRLSDRAGISGEEIEKKLIKKFLESIDTMGTDCPLKLSVVWSMAYKYVVLPMIRSGTNAAE